MTLGAMDARMSFLSARHFSLSLRGGQLTVTNNSESAQPAETAGARGLSGDMWLRTSLAEFCCRADVRRDQRAQVCVFTFSWYALRQSRVVMVAGIEVKLLQRFAGNVRRRGATNAARPCCRYR